RRVQPQSQERLHARAPASQLPADRERGRPAHQVVGLLLALAREGGGMTAEQMFERLVATLAAEPGVTLGKAFHNPGLKLGPKLFAMLYHDALVVKLPAARCRELLARGEVGTFD